MRAPHGNRVTRSFGLAGLALFGALALSPAAQSAEGDSWKELQGNVFPDRRIEADSPLVSLSAPTRAEDAALVPVDVTVALPEGDARTVSAVTLIVDENPAPVAATFRFGPGRHAVTLSTRLRVNSYSFVRAVAETSDGQLHMAARFVKASGGCSAPALKDADEALAHLGEMRFRLFGRPEAPAGMTPLPQAQLMIRHPNNSGLQMDQLTRLYIPARFVRHVTVRQGDELVLEMEGGISLSEDPTLRFSVARPGRFEVVAEDTDGKVFKRDFDAKAADSGS